MENPVVIELPLASRPSRTMLFRNVAVPCPSIVRPETLYAEKVDVTLSEWTRFCSMRLGCDESKKSIPQTDPTLPAVTVLLSECTMFCAKVVGCVARGALTRIPVMVTPGLLALPFMSLTRLPAAFSAFNEL
ncbi:MAG: hypothetical protein DME65_13850 [Verrucomicrobia bacterium]|nr:MAG: hypothetical protein DME65_13850 [Verrucomicrobiota bacterium]